MKIYLLPILVITSLFSYAQHHVKGRIVDDMGFPILMASITLSNSENIAYSDYEGNFELESDKDFYWKIEIASKGYSTETFYVLNAGNTGDIALSYELNLDEILENGTGFLDFKLIKPKLFYTQLFQQRTKYLLNKTL
ncbi:hypothetical protein GCM10011414_21770 [Croceivirga lutea]|uniref:hypothetical protein n=1 Tax=Croceivirga lutea TaxID=1775167 RepID=UPI00163983E6|nr:hypothetical protein [Croceivirga lutea]GGG51806.1 hypothetical protein GCM10011414_21770 [Croceivirga lutea]